MPRPRRWTHARFTASFGDVERLMDIAERRNPGGHVILRDAPTRYGPVSIELRRADAQSVTGC